MTAIVLFIIALDSREGEKEMDRSRLFLAFLVLLPLFVSLASSGAYGATLTFMPGQQIGTVQLPDLNEICGIGVSRKNANVLWAANDSPEDLDPENRVFALTPQGTHLGMYNLPGADNYDYADMAVGPGPDPTKDYIYVGDFGDDYKVRNSVNLYRVPEPTVSATQTPVTDDLTGGETFHFVFPDGKHDSHTMILDPINHDVYVLTREYTSSGAKNPILYRAPAAQLVSGATITLEKKYTFPFSSFITSVKDGQPTSASVSPDGQQIIIRTPLQAAWWPRAAGTNLWDAFTNPATIVPMVVTEDFGQSIAFDVQGLGYYSSTEGASAPIFYYARVPEPTSFRLLLLGFLAFIRRR